MTNIMSYMHFIKSGSEGSYLLINTRDMRVECAADRARQESPTAKIEFTGEQIEAFKLELKSCINDKNNSVAYWNAQRVEGNAPLFRVALDIKTLRAGKVVLTSLLNKLDINEAKDAN